MTQLNQKHFILGITGGIAAYKAAELTRLLIKDGANIKVVMTQAATHFITPATFQALSNEPVWLDLWDNRIKNGMAHIDLSRDSDAIIVAPASADFIAKIAHGQADDLLTTLCLARDCPLILAPAMNRQMWEHPATQRNVTQAQMDGVFILGPEEGEQACGETGLGRMLEPQAIYEDLLSVLTPKLFPKTRILITAGPTYEPIDAVRGITNSSSGKMGYELARACVASGATVTLVSGPTNFEPPRHTRMVHVTSALQMYDQVIKEAASSDIFISVAAVADYRPAHPRSNKIQKHTDNITLELTPNPDILATVATGPNAPWCVGFAAESGSLLTNAQAKRKRKKLPLIIANSVDAINSAYNEPTLIDDNGEHPLPKMDKSSLALQLVEEISRRYHQDIKRKI
ncbi:MAG: bifunctional phosphopantothenoylcysteine decarboxylase/phosphopantothenate--cysteine ligase CoaBC [Proteobacteria bacterium]|nr:bifunctional phosphopantothenoylcysteine decarboxylase/phosphopantothenate--cysteine ligase CoaBC [Pseudomonadota bacterium]